MANGLSGGASEGAVHLSQGASMLLQARLSLSLLEGLGRHAAVAVVRVRIAARIGK